MPDHQLHLLHWNASAQEREQVRRLLADSDTCWAIREVESREACEEALKEDALRIAPVDAVLAAYRPGGTCRLSFFDPTSIPLAAGIPLVLLVDPHDEPEAAAALDAGATDYVLTTSSQLQRLPMSLKLAVAATGALRATPPQLRTLDPLRDSQSNSSAVLDSLPIGVAILDGQGLVEYVNAAWSGFQTGTSQCLELKPGDHFLQAIGSLAAESRAVIDNRATPETFANAVRMILAGLRESYAIEFRPETCDGARWYRLQAEALDQAGKRGALITCSEVTQRVTAESTVHFQAQLLENIHDAVCATDMSFKITAWNAAAERLYGWSAAEVIGKQLEDVVPCPRSADGWDSVFLSAQSSQPYRDDLVHLTRDRRRVNVTAIGVPLRDA